MRNARIRGLGETVLRVRDPGAMKEFYTQVIGLEVLREFASIAFLRIADGHGGHTQIFGMFEEGQPVPIPHVLRQPVNPPGTSLHHFALEIDRVDYEPELARLRGLGVEVTTATHAGCHWRSMYVRDPEDNIVELVCYDETVR